LVVGSNEVGALTMPASRAAWATLSLPGFNPKYTWLAAATP
jgi:hypothetical protein